LVKAILTVPALAVSVFLVNASIPLGWAAIDRPPAPPALAPAADELALAEVEPDDAGAADELLLELLPQAASPSASALTPAARRGSLVI